MMISDQQFRRLKEFIRKEPNMRKAADLCSMDIKTAKKYSTVRKLPSQLKPVHDWVTRKNPFDEVWSEVKELLETNPGLQAKTIFNEMVKRYPGKFQEGQKRSLERKVKYWRATEGPPKEVFFTQKHYPGVLCASDFTCMNKLGITIQHIPFQHLFYHFVLTYSNWEHVSLCYSESFESLSEGVQNALWELGRVPTMHRSDRMTAAVKNLQNNKDEFTKRYGDLLGHYHMKPSIIQASHPHENGDIEQRNYRFKSAVKQALMLRGSCDFESKKEYMEFITKLLREINSCRQERLLQELDKMSLLPAKRMDDFKLFTPKVTCHSTIRVNNNTYSVPSRLRGEEVKVKQYAVHLDVFLSRQFIVSMPRIKGSNKHKINYRHIIDWLVRKPGAFEQYCYKEDLFPTSWFRIAYDQLKESMPSRSSKEYLLILELAAKESEVHVNEAIQCLYNSNQKINSIAIMDLLTQPGASENVPDIHIKEPDLKMYDCLIFHGESI